MSPANKLPLSTVIHTVIGIGLMLLGHVLPCPSMIVPVSDALLSAGFPPVDGGAAITTPRLGLVNAMIFLGVVYLWTFVDTLWPCFLGVLMLAFSGFTPAPKVLSAFFGNPMVVMIFFTLCFAAALIKSNVSSWLAHWILRRDFIIGRPWVFTGVILLGITFTNFCNSVVLGLVLTPVLLAMCNAFGLNSGPLMACFIYAVLIAICTPAASPFAAILFGNTQWLPPGDIITYSVSSSLIIAAIIIIVGIPLAMIIF